MKDDRDEEVVSAGVERGLIDESAWCDDPGDLPVEIACGVVEELVVDGDKEGMIDDECAEMLLELVRGEASHGEASLVVGFLADAERKQLGEVECVVVVSLVEATDSGKDE